MTRASFRLFRTGLIGSVILALAAGGHLAGGGRFPPPVILIALCAVAMIPVAFLTRFRLSFPVLTGLLAAGQAWLHWTFGALSVGALSVGARAAAGPGAVPGPAAHGHAGHAADALTPELFDAVMARPDAGMGTGMDAAMFAAHAVATLGTALLLARGERALSTLASWFRPLVCTPEPVAIAPARAARTFMASRTIPGGRAGLRLPARRGPPAYLPAA